MLLPSARNTIKMLFHDEYFWIEFGVISMTVIMIMTVIALCMKCCLKNGNDRYYEVVNI